MKFKLKAPSPKAVSRIKSDNVCRVTLGYKHTTPPSGRDHSKMTVNKLMQNGAFGGNQTKTNGHDSAFDE